jgi:transposase
MNEFPARLFVGVDWATREHQACVLDPDGSVLEEHRIRHGGEALAAFCDRLFEISEGEPSSVHVAIEVPHGPVVETMLERGFTVHAINPKQLDRFRDRFTVAGAKDDRRDALVLASSLRTDAQCYRRLELQEPFLIELREWSRMREELQVERVRFSNRMREQLRRYYPQLLELTSDVGSSWFLELWQRVPTPQRARRVRKATIAAILRRHRIRKVNAARVLETLHQKPLCVAPGTTEAAVAHVRLLRDRLLMVNEQLRACDQRLDELLGECPQTDEIGGAEGQEREQRDVDILRTLPGVGRIVLATLLAEAWQPLCSRDYQALRALSGVAPVTRQSGKSKSVSRRRACHRRLVEACYHWARVASQREPGSSRHYRKMRERGLGHARALRGVADRLLAMACAMLRAGKPYDPSLRTA